MSQIARATDVQKEFAVYQDLALVEPVVVTKNGEESVVILSAKEYRRLKRLDRQALAVTELSEADLKAIAQAEVSEKYSVFDDEDME